MPSPEDQSHWPHGDLQKLRLLLEMTGLLLLCFRLGMGEECTPHARECVRKGRWTGAASAAFPPPGFEQLSGQEIPLEPDFPAFQLLNLHSGATHKVVS